ncbi:hypothetical protein HYV84_04620 [Candidatus Woesearchaeota archaeon]|nr:hypothetical protein [Candidatus Woesearchaeota archaeon]
MDIGKISIKPTGHYQAFHSDVEWELVISAILSPHKVRLNKRYGKDRFSYIKKFKKFVIEVHTKNDELEGIVWVINAFKVVRS